MWIAGSIPLVVAVATGRPAALLALLAAAAPPLLARRAAKRGHHVSAFSVALQSLALALAAVALSAPAAALGPGREKPVLVFHDVSGSCRIQRDQFVQLPADVPVERLAFASSVAADANDLDPNRTDAAGMLRLAAARAPDAAGCVFHTDGRFSDQWSAAAEALGAANLPVVVVPMDSPPADARIARFDADRTADGKVRLSVTVRSNALDRRTLIVRRVAPPAGDEPPLIDRPLDLLADEPVTIRATDNPPPAAAAVYRAELTPFDTFAENDSAEAAVLPIRRTVAVIASDDASGIAAGLVGDGTLAGAAVRTVRPGQVRADADWWMDFSAVVLADAKGQLLNLPARRALAVHVRSGGGLVLLGAGPHGGPADRDDPLNEVAALVANPYQRKPLRLIVILDASGSMAEASAARGRVKFDQAAEAVRSLRRHLTPADSLEVITFSDDANSIYDSQPGPPDFGAVGEALSRVRPGGSTDISKALHLAAKNFTKVSAGGRQGLVLVVSDLNTKPFDALAMADAYRGRGLDLAVVSISAGRGPRPQASPLEALARLLKAPLVVGREDLSGLASIFAKLLRRTRGQAQRRGLFDAAVVRPMLGLTPGALPEVRSYLLAGPQPGAEVVAEVAADHDPLLAVRQVGLGRSVTLVMPVGKGENVAWQSGEFARILRGATAWALRPGIDPRFDGKAGRRDGQIALAIEARDANGPVNDLELAGRMAPIAGGSGQAGVSFPIEQTAPGRYEGVAPGADATLAVEVVSGQSAEASAKGGRVVWQAVVSAGAPPEFAAIGPDHENLNRLAELTGGRIVNSRQLDSFGRRLAEARRTSLWPFLLAAAAGLMLIEWAVTRVRRRT